MPFSLAPPKDAAFFRHSHTLSAFQVQLQLPCDEDLWDAPNALEWKRLHDEARPPIQFISALKACLTATHDPPSLNPFSRIAVLHGLLSVSQDLHWCGRVDSSLASAPQLITFRIGSILQARPRTRILESGTQGPNLARHDVREIDLPGSFLSMFAHA